jgi:hypothetical protein
MFSLFLDYNLGILGNPGLSPTQPNENPNPFLATRPKPKPAWVGLIPPRTRPDPTQTTAYWRYRGGGTASVQQHVALGAAGGCIGRQPVTVDVIKDRNNEERLNLSIL